MTTRFDSSSASSIQSSLLQRYEIKGEINKGGMGVVYRAYDSLLKKEVALKVMLSAEKAVARDRFDREARVLSALAHPNIPRITDYGVSDGKPYIAMELIEGSNLQELIDKEVRTTGEAPEPQWLATILADVADALAYCHHQGFIHRDIKPANIVISSFDERPVLVDFGIVKRTPSAQGSSPAEISRSLSLSGEFIGSPAYMSPEQLCQEQYGEVGPPTDVWGLGTTLYFCLTGETPFEGHSTLELYAARLTEPAPPPLKVNKKIPRWLSDLSNDCQEIAYEDRPTMREVADRLRAGSGALQPQSSKRASLALFAIIGAALGVVLGYSLAPAKKAHLSLEQSIVRLEAKLSGDVPSGSAHLYLGQSIIARDLKGPFQETIVVPPGSHLLRLVDQESQSSIQEHLVIRDDTAPKLTVQGRQGPVIFALAKLGRLPLDIEDLTQVSVTVDGNSLMPDPKTGRFELLANSGRVQNLVIKDKVGLTTEAMVTVLERGETLKVLESLQGWDNASEKLIDSILTELSRKLGSNFQFLRLREHQCGKQKHKIATFRESRSGVEFQLIPGGQIPSEFKLKEASGKTVKPFLIGRFELTRKEWLTVTNGTSKGDARQSLPVTGMKLRTFEDWLKLTEGFRVPTIEEWHWAASGGAKTKFPWGNEIDLSYVWSANNSGGEIHSVYEHIDLVNGFGLSDVFGNVWEWCLGNSIQGFSWADESKIYRYSNDGGSQPNQQSTNVGYRIAYSIPR